MISCLQRIQKKGHLKLLPRPPSQGNCSVFLISQETPTCRKMLKGQGQAPVFSNCVRSIDGRLILSHKPLIFRSPTVNWGVSSSHRLRPEASNHSSSNSGCWGPLCSKQGVSNPRMRPPQNIHGGLWPCTAAGSGVDLVFTLSPRDPKGRTFWAGRRLVLLT